MGDGGMSTHNRSRILSFDHRWESFRDGEGIDWVCADNLRQYYKIPRECRIRFVARKNPDPGFTYKLVCSPTHPFLSAPEPHHLYQRFWRWLRKQAFEGRQHIGVLILPEREDV